jgi:MFS family permease
MTSLTQLFEQMTYLQVFMILSMPVAGMCYAILGAIKLPLAERLQIDEAKVGGLVSAFGFMVGPIILLCGFLSDELGRWNIWFPATLLVMLSLCILAQAKRYLWAVVAVLLLAAGWAGMINVANPLMFKAYDNVFVATNLLDFFFGVGAFLTPAVTVYLVRKVGFPSAATFLGVLALVPAVMSIWTDMAPEQTGVEAPLSNLVSDPVMWLCAATLMLWVPIESSTAAWVTTFVADRAPQSEAQARGRKIAAWSLSGFWFCFIAGRLATAAMAHYHLVDLEAAGNARLMHIALAAATAGLLLGLAFSRKRWLTVTLVMLAGLVYGPFFPTLVGILLQTFDPGLHGRAIGFFFGVGSIGWTIIPIFIGKVADRYDLRRGFLVAAGTAVLLIGLVTAHAIYGGLGTM